PLDALRVVLVKILDLVVLSPVGVEEGWRIAGATRMCGVGAGEAGDVGRGWDGDVGSGVCWLGDGLRIGGERVVDGVETDYELAQRLQAEEQEELTIEEKSKLFQQFLEKRRKQFAAKRAEERRSKPPTKSQQRSIMTAYLKNMAGWKPKDLKNKSFASVQELFKDTMKRVNTFVDMDTELVEGSEIREEESSSKRAGDELEQEPTKKQKFDREDLENLWKLVKAKHGNTRPEEGYERVLWGYLKTMFKHHIEDLIWRNFQGKKVLLWRLYDSCGVHFVRFEDMHVYMLVKKRYPLTPATITDMLNKKLKSDY
ncbi:hypothetical protein Tco_0765433, partial [Tanacetum coccineum]